jgi:hypothetical protein
MTLFIIADIVIIIVCVIGFFLAYRVWCIMGKRGITSWFMLAMLYAVILRTFSLLSDMDVIHDFADYSKAMALPLYILLLMGLWGIYRQIKHAITRVVEVPPVEKVIIDINAVELTVADKKVVIPGRTIELPVDKPVIK